MQSKRHAFLTALAVVVLFAGSGYGALHGANAAEVTDEIHSSFGANPDQMWLYWHGLENTVYYGTSTTYGYSAVANSPAIKPQDLSGNFWQVELRGLTPGTTYHYRIGSGGVDHTFQTSPTGDFSWIDIGDTGTSYYDPAAGGECNKIWMPSVWQQIASEQPTFVTHGGDISYASDCGNPAVHQFWNDIEPVSTQAAMQFAWGNHEYGPVGSNAPAGTTPETMANYKGRFNMPNAQTAPYDSVSRTDGPGCPSPSDPSVNGCQGDDWGYFTAGHVLFINYPEPWNGAYTDWGIKADALMAQAESDPNIYFIVTYGHRPAYTSGNDNATIKSVIDGLGDKYSPSARPDGKYVLNIAHHVHGGEVFAPQHGVVHITNGGGGTGETKVKQDAPGSLWLSDHFEHLRAQVTDNKMKIDMICGPVYAIAPDAYPCNQGDVLYSLTLNGYKAGPPAPAATTSVSDGVSSAQKGEALNYTVTASNPSTVATSADTNLSVTIPGNLVVNDAGGGTVSGNTISWNIGSLAAGQSVSKLIKTTLQSGNAGDSFSVFSDVSTSDDTCTDTLSQCHASDTDTIAGLAPQYIPNQSLESSLDGWVDYNKPSVLSRDTSQAHDGLASMLILRGGRKSGTAGTLASPEPVSSTVAGTTYSGSVWVKGQKAGQIIKLQLRELSSSGSILKRKTVSITVPDTNWHQLSADYQVSTSGHQIAFVVYGTSLAPNTGFYADMMSLTSN